MNYVLKHLEKAIDEMAEAAGELIYLAAVDDETANKYMEIFTSTYTEMLALYGLIYAETQRTIE